MAWWWNIEMDGSPDAKQHGNDTCTQDVKGAAGVRARLPAHSMAAIAK